MKWEKVKINDAFFIIRNGASIKQIEGASGTPITRIETIASGEINLNRLGYANILADDNYSQYFLKNGDILMSHINSLKHLSKSAIVKTKPEFNIIHGMNLLLLRTNALLNPFFAKYYFETKSFYNDILRIANQSVNQCSFTVGNLKKLEIPLPPLPIQKTIAEKLDKADALRNKDRELLKHYDELAQAVFIEMFGDPVKNEKGWEVEKLQNLTVPVSKINRNFKLEKINYIDISSVDNKRNEVVGFTQYEINERPSRAQQILNKGDILFSTVRPNLKNIAINNNEDRIGSTGFYVFRTNKKIEPLFLFKILLSDGVTKEFEGMVSGANYPALRSVDIDNFEIILPPLPLQQKFAGIIENIELQKQKVKLQAQESENLFQALLQESFGG